MDELKQIFREAVEKADKEAAAKKTDKKADKKEEPPKEKEPEEELDLSLKQDKIIINPQLEEALQVVLSSKL